MPRTTLVSFAVCTAVLGGCHDVVEESDISYDDRFETTRFDVYSPPPAAAPRPAVLVIHGGGWAAGVAGERGGMADHARRFAAAGYVAFNLSYRLVGNDGDESGVFPRAVQDAICALSFIRAHADDYGIDPDRIGAYGYSAGGHLASMLGVAENEPLVQPDCASGPTGPVNAVISGAGPEDMTALPQVYVVTDFIGGTKDEVPELYAAASPLTHVRPGAPPFLFIHGSDDWFVNFTDNTIAMRDALLAVGSEARVLKLPGGGHLWNRTASGDAWDIAQSIDTPAAWEASIDFFDHRIGPVE